MVTKKGIGATRQGAPSCSEDSQSFTLFKVRETFISNTIIVASCVDISVSRVSLSQGLTLLVRSFARSCAGGGSGENNVSPPRQMISYPTPIFIEVLR